MLYWCDRHTEAGTDIMKGRLDARRPFNVAAVGVEEASPWPSVWLRPTGSAIQSKSPFRMKSPKNGRRQGVVALQHPGLWVITEDRRVWFVTNGKRIRPQVPSPLSCEERGEGQGEGWVTAAPHPESS